jgi:transposase
MIYNNIRQLRRNGLTKEEIIKTAKVSRGTVYKYYNMDEEAYKEYKDSNKERQKKVSKYEKILLEFYDANNNKKINYTAVYDYLQECFEDTLDLTYQTFRNFIKYLLTSGKLVYNTKKREYKKVEELPFGKQLQIDFGEYILPDGSKIYIFGAVLSASRYKYAAFSIRPFRTIDLIMNLLNCFDYIGGIPAEIVIDQDKTMVVNENYGDIIYTKDFNFFKDEMGFDVFVCRKADPETKGKIENFIGYIKKNFLNGKQFLNFEDAAMRLSKWLNRVNKRISVATKRPPIDDITEERKNLKPIRNSIYRKTSLIGREKRKVIKNYILVDSTEYSVPSAYSKEYVEIYRTEASLFIFDVNNGEQIAEHVLCRLPGKRIMNRDHFRSKKIDVSTLKNNLMKLFDDENWREFIELNYKRHSRYVRDQYHIFEVFYKGKGYEESLKKAVAFCVENKNYSFTELKDTYEYYKSMLANNEFDILKEMQPQLKHIRKCRQDVKVAKRGLGFYKSLVSVVRMMLLL